jgi:pilus assembly protein CpaB
MQSFNFRRLLPSVTGWMLVGAVVTAAIALAAIRHYLQERERELLATSARAQETRSVIVAAHDLRQGETIAATDLAIRQVPARFVASDGLGPDGAARLVGRRLTRGRRSGDAVAEADLDAPAGVALSARVQEGMRAVTIPVDELGSLAEQLRPGDRIDLYFFPQVGGEASRIGLLLSQVRVLATGSDSGGGVRAGDYSTLTLELAPEDAERVALAQHAGQLSIVLRGGGDTTKSPASVRVARTLLAGAAVPRVTREPALAAMELIVGGRGSGVAEASQVIVPTARE